MMNHNADTKEFPFSCKFDHWEKMLAQASPLSDPPTLSDSKAPRESPPEVQESGLAAQG